VRTYYRAAYIVTCLVALVLPSILSLSVRIQPSYAATVGPSIGREKPEKVFLGAARFGGVAQRYIYYYASQQNWSTELNLCQSSVISRRFFRQIWLFLGWTNLYSILAFSPDTTPYMTLQECFSGRAVAFVGPAKLYPFRSTQPGRPWVGVSTSLLALSSDDVTLCSSPCIHWLVTRFGV